MSSAIAELQGVETMRCDVRDDQQLRAVFNNIEEKSGRPDFLVHSIAFAAKDDLHGRVVDCSRNGFSLAEHRLPLLYPHGTVG